MAMDRHSTYVGMTRHRDGARLRYGRDDFADQRQLVRALSRERSKDMASDYAKPEKDQAARSQIDARSGSRNSRVRWRRRFGTRPGACSLESAKAGTAARKGGDAEARCGRSAIGALAGPRYRTLWPRSD
jgi:hypothetical protein